MKHSIKHSIKHRTTTWHIQLIPNPGLVYLDAITLHTVIRLLELEKFSVSPLPESQLGYTVSHTSSSAWILFILKYPAWADCINAEQIN